MSDKYEDKRLNEALNVLLDVQGIVDGVEARTGATERDIEHLYSGLADLDDSARDAITTERERVDALEKTERGHYDFFSRKFSKVNETLDTRGRVLFNLMNFVKDNAEKIKDGEIGANDIRKTLTAYGHRMDSIDNLIKYLGQEDIEKIMEVANHTMDMNGASRLLAYQADAALMDANRTKDVIDGWLKRKWKLLLAAGIPAVAGTALLMTAAYDAVFDGDYPALKDPTAVAASERPGEIRIFQHMISYGFQVTDVVESGERMFPSLYSGKKKYIKVKAAITPDDVEGTASTLNTTLYIIDGDRDGKVAGSGVNPGDSYRIEKPGLVFGRTYNGKLRSFVVEENALELE